MLPQSWVVAQPSSASVAHGLRLSRLLGVRYGVGMFRSPQDSSLFQVLPDAFHRVLGSPPPVFSEEVERLT